MYELWLIHPGVFDYDFGTTEEHELICSGSLAECIEEFETGFDTFYVYIVEKESGRVIGYSAAGNWR